MRGLLPCPFCGENGTIKTRYIGYGSIGLGGHDEYRVVCKECRTSSDEYRTKEQAIAAWNRRAGDDTNVATNAERIRSMNDEELHKFLLDFEAGDIDYAKTFCNLCCKDVALERKSTDCEGCLLWWLKNDATLPQGIDWLRQPVKEEHHETD